MGMVIACGLWVKAVIRYAQQYLVSPRWRSAAFAALLVVLVCALACEQRSGKERLYFREFIPPAGIGEVKVIKDEALDLATGGVMTVIATVDPDMDRDDLDVLLRSFYRQAAQRKGFRRDRPAERIDLRFYTSPAEAEAESEAWLGRALQVSASAEPDFANRQQLPLARWAKEALGEQPLFTGALKPVVKTDAETLSVEFTLPVVAEDGSGQYADQVTFVRAMREFSAYAQRFFERIRPLQQLTFIALHRNHEVLRIWLSREQYAALKLSDVDEALGVLSGSVVNALVTSPHRAAVERRAARQLAGKERTLYHALLKKMPPEQVVVATSLR